MNAKDISEAEGRLKGASLFDKYVSRQSPGQEEAREATRTPEGKEDIPGNDAQAQGKPVTTGSYKLVRTDTKENRTSRFQAALPAGLKALLDRESERSGMSKNEIVIQALYRYLKDKEKGR